jgi:signal transduction histidine kinase
MRRALVASVLACLAGGVVVELALDTHAALETFSLMLGVSILALGVAVGARHERRRIGALGHQLALAVGIAVAAILAAVGVAAGLMFISSEDALLVSVMAGVVAVVGLQVATLLTAPIVEDITRLRDRLRAVGVGDRRANLATNGNDELAELVAEANAMIARLAQEEGGRTRAEDARQRLIIAVSHDLRTPLTSLRLMTEAIDDEIATGPTRARYLRDMQTHVAALSALVDDLFDLSRLQAGEATLTIEPADIGALADETVRALRATAATREVTLSCRADRIGHQLLVAEIDRERIRRVLMNLIDNAVRHSPPGGEVSTHVARVDATIEVQVSDDGSGIPEAERAHVFEAFFRGGPDASRSGDGTGLGLAISRAIIDSHRGSIWLADADADADRGTRVCFTIPASALVGEQAPRRAGAAAHGGTGNAEVPAS